MNIKPEEFQEIIRIIYCTNSEDFKVIFGETMGAHLWSKISDGNVGKFICALDLGNMRSLLDYCESRLAKKGE